MRALLGLVSVGLLAPAAVAAPPFGLGVVDPGEPISIRADKLEASEAEGVRRLAFHTNVEVRQGALELQAQQLVARYPKDARQPEWLEASGEVRIRQGERRAQCEEASYDRKARRLVCRGEPARLWDGEDRLAGREVVFDLDERRVRVEGGCEVEIRRSLVEAGVADADSSREWPEAPAGDAGVGDQEVRQRLREGGPVTIRALRLEARELDGERRIRFDGDVRVRQGELRLRADELEARYPPESSEPDRLLARGGVSLAEGSREGRCERADYRPRERRVTCEGNAQLRDGPDELTGQRIAYDFAAQRVEVVGATRLRVAGRVGERR